MQTKILYEWSLETYDTEGDIIDNDFSETPFMEIREDQKICLVRSEWNERDGITDRFWAYVNDGELPEYFSDANECEINIRVPKKYKSQLSKSIL